MNQVDARDADCWSAGNQLFSINLVSFVGHLLHTAKHVAKEMKTTFRPGGHGTRHILTNMYFKGLT
jgi:hypothetical protein